MLSVSIRYVTRKIALVNVYFMIINLTKMQTRIRLEIQFVRQISLFPSSGNSTVFVVVSVYIGYWCDVQLLAKHKLPELS
jgi:hypothetical protein